LSEAIKNESMTGNKIGFVGLGNMGAPMARHLHAAGAEVIVWNRSPEPAEAAVRDGLSRAKSLQELAERVGDGVICVNLTLTDVVEKLVFGEGGLHEKLDPDALIIDFGTTGVPATKRFAEKVNWVDSPVSGGEVGAKAANLTIMVGGAVENFERALPILEVVGEKITHVGESGAGQVTKLANQLIVAQTIDAVAQALRMAELAGVDSGTVREALRGGFAESRILDLHGDRMVRRDFEPGGKATWQLKDVRLMCELAESVGLKSSTLENSSALWEKFVADGYGDLDHSGLFLIYEEGVQNGVKGNI
jgi:3-hydroxyisobutyrate dehydrogenase-like beta-hydroxyacid dehydrogenase